MFKWYMEASVCYVYLTDHDVFEARSIDQCRWFKRGWTLQELIAPTYVNFYDRNWHFINDKISISSELSRITRIDESLLRCGHTLDPPLLEHHRPVPGDTWNKCSCGRPAFVDRLSQLQDYCVAQKMAWASTRETTRQEDEAYCLMGLFEVNMPLLYGEGHSRAFFRLQREMLENTMDQSILAMDYVPGLNWRTALASRPSQFLNSGVVRFRRNLTMAEKWNNFCSVDMNLTKLGVDVELLMVPEISSPDDPTDSWFGILDFQMGNNPLARPALPLRPIEGSDNSPTVYAREIGLYVISPEHPHHAKASHSDVEAIKLSSSLRFRPDREIDVRRLRRQTVTIIQNLEDSARGILRKGLHTPIRCVSSSHGCQPFSVQGESGDRAILYKTGYPRLLIDTFSDDSFTRYSSAIWKLEDIYYSDGLPDNEESAGRILNKLKLHRTIHRHEDMGSVAVQGLLFADSNVLVVRGPPDLKVEVKVTRVQFLDWTAPEITVTTTRVG